jgi:DNA-directed RNA polymerase specialized sigma24 family protein
LGPDTGAAFTLGEGQQVGLFPHLPSILVERARRRLRQRHAGGQERVDIDVLEIAAPTEHAEDLLAMHEALDRFAALDPERAEFVKLRYFVGLSQKEAARALGVSLTTCQALVAVRPRLAEGGNAPELSL